MQNVQIVSFVGPLTFIHGIWWKNVLPLLKLRKSYSFASIVAFYRSLCPLRFLLSLRALDFLHSHLRNLVSLMVQPSPISMCAE